MQTESKLESGDILALIQTTTKHLNGWFVEEIVRLSTRIFQTTSRKKFRYGVEVEALTMTDSQRTLPSCHIPRIFRLSTDNGRLVLLPDISSME
mmetsp:Transcript_6740/g.9853  ORF Transcript_6740/g.9853 Transcript_6740/m.9853 type:complete len:94 (-) Transcript_6740:116-397(-)